MPYKGGSNRNTAFVCRVRNTRAPIRPSAVERPAVGSVHHRSVSATRPTIRQNENAWLNTLS